MARITIILILLGIILFGFVVKLFDNRKLYQRLEYTESYRNDFLTLYEQINKSGKYDEQLYYKLMQEVHKIQSELGVDGIISVYQDQLAGIRINNYPLFLNFFNELRTQMLNYSLFAERIYLSVGSCDEAMTKHIGLLKEAIHIAKKDIINPFRCFSCGINTICSIPVKILEWCQIINVSSSGRILNSKLHTLISKVITLIGLVGSLITIILGWNQVVSLFKLFI